MYNYQLIKHKFEIKGIKVDYTRSAPHVNNTNVCQLENQKHNVSEGYHFPDVVRSTFEPV